MSRIQRVGIVGAGLSGLMAAQTLRGKSQTVTVFEKARRPGGRANTREHGPYRFDHGAQFFTVRDPVLRPFLDSWLRKGIVAEWTGRVVRVENGDVRPAKESVRYVGVPGMISLPSHLASGIEVRAGTRVERIVPNPPGWTLYDDSGSELGSFDTVLLALPAPQAGELAAHAPRLRAQVEAVEMAPCWAGMFVFEEPLRLGFDGAFLAEGPLSWIARNSCKPGRPGEEAWVLHAGPDWSREHLGMDRDEAARALLKEFTARFSVDTEVTFQRAHRWAFAQGSEPFPHGAVFDGESSIGSCGDWCMGGRIEGALLSGMAAADLILAKGP